MHSQMCRRFQVQGSIVNKAAFFRRNLRDLKRQSVDLTFRLPQAYKTRTHEDAKYLLHPAFLNPVQIQFGGLVVNGPHEIFARTSQSTSKIQNLRKRL